MNETKMVDLVWSLINVFSDQDEETQNIFLNELNDPYQALTVAAEVMPATDEELLRSLQKGWEEALSEEEAAEIVEDIPNKLLAAKSTDWGMDDDPSDEYLRVAAAALNPILHALVDLL